MLGIVLCGGQSLRMGTDKGLLKHRDQLWAKLAAAKLNEIGLAVKCAVNAGQFNEYSKYFGDDELIVDNPSLELKGPLLGLLSSHLSFPTSNLFVLACDLLKMEVQLLNKLLEVYKSKLAFDAYVFVNDGEREPLCAIYTFKSLNDILLAHQSTGLAKHSMKFVLGNMKVCEVVLQDQEKFAFRNFNSQAELNNL